MMTLSAVATGAVWGCGGIAIEQADASAVLKVKDEASAETSNPALPPCQTQADCYLGQGCQQGWCCAGIFDHGACRCGEGPGCPLQSTCCQDPAMDYVLVCTPHPPLPGVAKCYPAVEVYGPPTPPTPADD